MTRTREPHPRLGRLAGAFVITALLLGTLMILTILTGVAVLTWQAVIA